jgi:hypothetical protein
MTKMKPFKMVGDRWSIEEIYSDEPPASGHIALVIDQEHYPLIDYPTSRAIGMAIALTSGGGGSVLSVRVGERKMRFVPQNYAVTIISPSYVEHVFDTPEARGFARYLWSSELQPFPYPEGTLFPSPHYEEK